MWRICTSRKDILGFDDRWAMILGIPIVAVTINTLLFGHLIQNADYRNFGACIPISMYFTTIYWLSFRELHYFLIKKMDRYEDFRKRQAMTFVAIFLGYICLNYLGNLLLHSVFDVNLHADMEPKPILKVITTLVFSFLILTIYEGSYLSTQLGKMMLDKEKLYKENISAQLSELRNQINPHFLFNSLNTLSSLIQEDHHRAEQFLIKLSKVFRHMLDQNEANLITLKDELVYLHAYIHVLKERFGENLIYEENIDPSLLNKFIVPLSLQITFENCVQHNVVSQGKPLKVVISTESRSISITNNTNKLSRSNNSTQTGLDNLRRRYAFFTKEQVEVVETNQAFSVLLPLLNDQKMIH